jgi:surface polysaccharide O-acyltransferase-like enzyme
MSLAAPRLPQDVSDRIEILRFPLIVGVVFIHAFPVVVKWLGETLGTPEPGLISIVVRNLLSEGLFRIPVPMLFFISGLLFFWNVNGTRFSQDEFVRKFRARVRTLLVPFLFWNVVVLVFIGIAQNSGLREFFAESYPIRQYTPFNYVNAILGITHAPIAYQFWFVRNLIVLVFLSPLIYWVLRLIPIPFLLGMGFLWLGQFWPIRIPDAPGLFFFSLGGYLGLRHFDLRRIDRFWWILLPTYGAVLAFDVALKPTSWSGQVHHLGILLGVPWLFSATRFAVANARVKAALLALAPASFFLYASHEPLLMLLRKSAYILLRPQGDLWVLLVYFAHPILVILVCTWAFGWLQGRVPRFMGWIAGGR